METPKLELFKTQKDGKVAIEVVVRNAMYSKELSDTISKLGYKPTVDMANRESIFVTTPQELDNVRGPIAHFFDNKGQWK